MAKFQLGLTHAPAVNKHHTMRYQ